MEGCRGYLAGWFPAPAPLYPKNNPFAFLATRLPINSFESFYPASNLPFGQLF